MSLIYFIHQLMTHFGRSDFRQIRFNHSLQTAVFPLLSERIFLIQSKAMKSLPAIQSEIIFKEWDCSIKEGKRTYTHPVTHQQFQWVQVDQKDAKELARRQLYDLPNTPKAIVLGHGAIIQQAELSLEQMVRHLTMREIVQLLRDASRTLSGLFQVYGRFKVTPEMVRGSKDGRVIVWHNADFGSTSVQIPVQTDSDQDNVIVNLVKIIQEKSKVEMPENVKKLAESSLTVFENTLSLMLKDDPLFSVKQANPEMLDIRISQTSECQPSSPTKRKMRNVPSFVKNLKPRQSINHRKNSAPKIVIKSRPRIMTGRGSVEVKLSTGLKGSNVPSLATIDESNSNLLSFDKNRLSGAVTLASSGQMDVKSPTSRNRTQTDNDIFLKRATILKIPAQSKTAPVVNKSEIRADLDGLFSEPNSPSVFARSPAYKKLTSQLNGLFE